MHYTYPLGLYKPSLDWRWYRDANPVPTSPLTDDTATVLLVPVLWLAARDILHAQSNRQGSTHHGLCCTGGIFYMYNQTHRVAHTTDCVALAGTRNSSLSSPIGINLMTSRHERTLPLNHVPLNIRLSGYVLRDRSDDLSHHEVMFYR